MRIFIDTSAFYALLDRDDENHRRAKSTWIDLLSNENTFLTSNYVLVETFALLQHRLGMEAVRGFQNDILPLVNIEFVLSEIHRSAVSALLSVSRRNLSLVDFVSFEMMRTLEMKTAFVFDPHFKEQGFNILP
jgi:predicted nucleic acid-binding protein